MSNKTFIVQHAKEWLQECSVGGGEQDMDVDNLFGMIESLVSVIEANDRREARRTLIETLGFVLGLMFGATLLAVGIAGFIFMLGVR